MRSPVTASNAQVAEVTNAAVGCAVIGTAFATPIGGIVASVICSVVYGVGVLYVNKVFADAAKRDGCVKATAGLGLPSLSSVPYSNKYCYWR